MTSNTIQARCRLWLRSERALGLSALPIRLAIPIPAAMPPRPRAAGAGSITSPVARPMTRPITPPTPVVAAQPAPVAGMSMAQSPVETAFNLSSETPMKAKLPAALPDVPFTSGILPTADKLAALGQMDQAEVRPCKRCRLCQTRTQTVFGEGDVDARIFFIGEGPGETEDKTGRPFVGRAGQKLDEMIAAMGLQRQQVYIGNIVKCRPPDNRVPASDEVEACTPYLVRQVELVRPKVIVTLGLPATRYMLKLDLSMGRMRGQWHSWRGIRLMPTYHPSYLLRNYTKETRQAVWSDLQQVMTELGLKAKG